MSEPVSEPRPPFAWNAGGWWGAQLGATVWMLLSGLVLLSRSLSDAIGALVCFAVPNAVGAFLWMCRRRLSAYAGVQLLLSLMGAACLVGVFFVERGGLLDEPWTGGPMPAALCYGLVTLVVGMLLVTNSLRQRAYRRSLRGR